MGLLRNDFSLAFYIFEELSAPVKNLIINQLHIITEPRCGTSRDPKIIGLCDLKRGKVWHLIKRNSEKIGS
jgi:hypothetical protein